MKETLNPNYWLNIGDGGTLTPNGSYSSSEEDLRRLVEQDIEEIVIFFHGGLVMEASGMENAEIWQAIWRQTDAHPYCIIWETFPTELLAAKLRAVLGNLDDFIQNTVDVLRSLWKDLFRGNSEKGFLARGAMGAAGSSDESQADFANLNEKQLEAMIQGELERDKDTAKNQAREKALKDLETVQKKVEETTGEKSLIGWISGAAVLAKAVFEAQKRKQKGRSHGDWETVQEEIYRVVGLGNMAKVLWNNMKDKAAAACKGIEPYMQENQRPGGTLLLKTLLKMRDSRRARANGAGNDSADLKIHLVGHSAGSIFINRLMEANAMKGHRLTFDSITFLAPACTLRDFHASTMKNRKYMNRFYLINLTNHAEKRDQMLTEALYANSLLYFVSGLLEEDKAQPLLGLHRHLQDEPPAPEFKYTKAEQQVRDFIRKDNKVKSILSPSEFCEAQTHGGFLDPPERANPNNGEPWLLKQTLHRFILGDKS